MKDYKYIPFSGENKTRRGIRDGRNYNIQRVLEVPSGKDRGGPR